MIDEITLTGSTNYNTSYPPKGAKKGYVAKITGRTAGAAKYEREFLGDRVTLVGGDMGLYERQVGEKKGGYTRYYHVVLEHPEHGLIISTDCEDELPKLAKLLDDGVSIADAVEVTGLRPSETHEGRWVFDATPRSKAQATKQATAASVGDAVDTCFAALATLDAKEQKKALAELRKRLQVAS